MKKLINEDTIRAEVIEYVNSPSFMMTMRENETNEKYINAFVSSAMKMINEREDINSFSDFLKESMDEIVGYFSRINGVV
jgi:hypothetical protein